MKINVKKYYSMNKPKLKMFYKFVLNNSILKLMRLFCSYKSKMKNILLVPKH
jgi:hypothetical protein